MTWNSIYKTIDNLDAGFPGWREDFQCVDGHPIFDAYKVLIDLNNESIHPVKEEIIGGVFFVDRPITTIMNDDVQFLCLNHWKTRFPNQYLMACASLKGYGRPVKERKDILRKAFAYARKHGYPAAIDYLGRFKDVE